MYEIVSPYYEAELAYRRERARRGVAVRRHLRMLRRHPRRAVDPSTVR